MIAGVPTSPSGKWRGLRIWTLVILIAGATLGIFATTGHRTIFLENRPTDNLLALTEELHGVTRVEIEAVTSQFENVKDVVGTKSLLGADATDFQDLWRSQRFLFDQHMMCHEPGYRIRFYNQAFLLTETTVCFHCENIYFYQDGREKYDTNFDVNSSAGLKLRDYLRNLFPGHDPAAPSP